MDEQVLIEVNNSDILQKKAKVQQTLVETFHMYETIYIENYPLICSYGQQLVDWTIAHCTHFHFINIFETFILKLIYQQPNGQLSIYYR